MMRRSKQPVLSTAGRRGVVYVAAYVLLVAAAAVLPFMLAGQLKSELSDQQHMLDVLVKHHQEAAEAGDAASPSKQDAARLLVPGATPGIAAAEMQRRIAGLANSSGLTVSRMQSLDAEQSGGAISLQLELQATGKIEEVQKFLHAIESGSPFIFVKDANISAETPDAADPLAGTDRHSIRMTLEASGWTGGN
jgi:hypothetical protein